MPRQKEFYIVSKIVGHRETGSGLEYKVHWKGFSASEDTWEPESNLKDCQEFIQKYIMSNLRAPQPRRSSRLANQSPSSIIYSDEEEEIVVPLSTKRKPRQKRQPKANKNQSPPPPPPDTSYSFRVLRSSAEPPPATQPQLPPSSTTRTYSLRSNKKVSMQYSSDEEDLGRTPARKVTGRMGLSETRFRKQLEAVRQKHTSSTPYSSDQSDTTTTTTSRSRKHDGDTLKTTTTTVTTRKATPLDAVEMGVAEDEDEEVEGEVETMTTVISEKRVCNKCDSLWHDLGWKEVALAGFLAGVGVIGYICYFNNVCNYC